MHATRTTLASIGLISVLSGSALAAPVTYQGYLEESDAPADGLYDMVFRLGDSPVLGLLLQSVAVDDVPVEEGLFTVEIEFDDVHFTGAERWLSVVVEGTSLNPRSKVTFAPYAIRAGEADHANHAEVATTLEVPWVIVTDTDIIDATSTRSVPIRGHSSSTSGFAPGVIGETSSNAPIAFGVLGRVNSREPGSFSAAVRGINAGTSTRGIGVHGSHDGSGWGVYGESPFGFGVYGTSQNATGVRANSGAASGLSATTTSGDEAVLASHANADTSARLATDEFGLEAYNDQTLGEGTAILGQGGRVGVYGTTDPNGFGSDLTRIGVQGFSGGFSTGANMIYGVQGFGAAPIEGGQRTAFGVYGGAQIGNSSNTAYGIFGEVVGPPGGTRYAGYFSGDVHVAGTLSKSGGAFKIDHPLDPENKYLMHSFVESPRMMNIYDGTVTLDEDGHAVVEMPSYFEALNHDFRYQLTAIGAPMPGLYVASEVSGNTFAIDGGVPGARVSWQVTGVRQDAAALHHEIVVEQDKAPDHRGRYLNPEAFGFGADRAIHASHADTTRPGTN